MEDDAAPRREGAAKVGKKLIVLAHTPAGEPQVRFSQRNRYVHLSSFGYRLTIEDHC